MPATSGRRLGRNDSCTCRANCRSRSVRSWRSSRWCSRAFAMAKAVWLVIRGEQFQVVPRELPVLPGGVQVDDAERLVVGDDRRAHHRADAEIHHAQRHGEALVAHRVGAEERHAVAHRFLDDGAADGDRLGLVAAALPRRARDQLLGLVGLQHDEAAVGLREDAEEAVHDLVEQLVHVELGLDGVADFEHGAEPLLGLDERVGRGRPLGHGGFHRRPPSPRASRAPAAPRPKARPRSSLRSRAAARVPRRTGRGCPASSIRSPSFSGVGAAMVLPFTAVPLPLPRSSMK